MTPQLPPIRASRRLNLNSVMRIGMLVALIALIGIPLFSSSSASSLNRAWKTGNSMAAPAMDSSRADSNEELVFAPVQVFSTNVGRTTSFPLIMPQATPTPSIATFESTCVTPDSEFNLGQEVCATATATGGSAANRRISWVDPSGFIRQVTPIAADPQNDHFTIPTTPTSTLSNGQVVNNIGNWRVNIISSRSSLVASTGFVVKDPANATADLSVTKRAPSNSEQVAAGSNGSFDIFVQNSGPDNAATVTLTDHVPNNTTFVAMIQTSGPTFTCTTVPDGLGNITCSIDTLAAGASATFNFVYTVNAGTPAGTLITNTASIASATTNELNNTDNSATASASVAAAGGGGSGCTVNCPGDVTTPADTTENGAPGAVVHFDSPSGDAACGTITSNHCNDCFFPVGTTIVTAIATTGESCSFNVNVTEGDAPTITCPPDKTATAASNCEATVDPGSPTTTGSDVTVTSSRSDGRPLSDPYPAGTTTITWTATNSSGTASCQQTVTVNDTTAPTITCPANITQANDPGTCSANINPGTATATDNCDTTPTVTGTRSDGQPLDAPYPAGTTTITWTATNGSGNTASCTQTVTVNDTENPTISCPAAITTSNDAGQCSATVDPGTPTASDNCGNPTVTGTRSDGQVLNAPYPKGTTTITWTATDGSNNSSSCTQSVTVNDTEAPAISCPANVTSGTDPGTCSATVNPGTATATDNCDTPTVTGTRSDGQALNAPYPKGTTTITWTATDGSGNSSSCMQTVTVNDTEAPTITGAAAVPPVLFPPNHKMVDVTVNYSTSDNCTPPEIISCVLTATSNQPPNSHEVDIIIVDAHHLQLRAERSGGQTRVYTITITCTDSSGNSTSQNVTVTVP